MSEQTGVAAPPTAADVMRPPLTTVEQQGHVAAAAYLMKHASATALLVLDAQTDQPIGIITEANIAHAVADGKDVNGVRRSAPAARAWLSASPEPKTVQSRLAHQDWKDSPDAHD